VDQHLIFPNSVSIREVGPRDGIQSETAPISTEDKIRLIDALSDTGVRLIEAVSFVSPAAVPQMADARSVWAGMRRRPGVSYSALVPNRKGAETASEAGVDGMQVFVAASESYNRRNLNKSIGDSLEDVADVVSVGVDAHIPVEGTLSTAFGCPYEGDVAPRRVADLSRALADLGIKSISYGDTTGMATPRRVCEVVDAVREETTEVRINMHFHDTRGTGLANVVTAMAMGVDYFDSSVGGMGGSPFAAGANGNVATEDLVHMCDDMNIDTGIDLGRLLDAARLAQGLVDGELPGKVLRAGPRLRLSLGNP
jgi:hydroxymethylglutaryl-CoA lyase